MVGSSASIRHQDVNATEVGNCSINDSFAVFALLDVSGNEMHVGTGIEFIKRALRLRFIATINDDFGTLVEKGLRNRETDSSGTSSNTSDFSIK
jgi:hypothetical protein